MKTISLLLLTFLIAAGNAEAVLPPLYESLKEYQALLNDKKLTEYLQSGELILDIKRNENNFQIVTNKHMLIVDIVYVPTGRIGPAEFRLEFHQPQSVE